MHNFKDTIFDFFKREFIFSISLILALISCFFVKPSVNYLNYINWDTIFLLFIVMLIVEVLKNLYVFEILLRKLLNKVKDTRGLVLFLVFSCLISAVFITNDVSLIIFVPFTILALNKVNCHDLIIITVSLETIAANVGCMLLPIGAPHNIVIYTMSNVSFESFFLILLPYVIVSFLFLAIMSFIVPSEDILLPHMSDIGYNNENMFKRVMCGVDYVLLLTFIALFILIGNLENISALNLFFEKWIVGNELIFGILSSQIISNVPAAILLSSFSTNYEAIIVGINLGGFGTLIASMANLISYNIIVKESDESKIKYLVVFTVLNIILLIILFGVYILII